MFVWLALGYASIILLTGVIANTMANGKDFFLELRKQVTALRQGGNVAGG
jgi:hypothetical protein